MSLAVCRNFGDTTYIVKNVEALENTTNKLLIVIQTIVTGELNNWADPMRLSVISKKIVGRRETKKRTASATIR